MIPPKDQITICFAHAAYQMKACFDALNTGIASFELRERDAFERRAHEAEVNTARGGCVVEADLVEALRAGRIAGAALDVTDPEPAEAESPLWAMPNVFITPHTGGETRKYEANVNEILVENLERMWRGETVLRNQVV